IAVSLDDNAPATMADKALETLRKTVPALRGLPLLNLLARGASGSISLDYLASLQLRVDMQAC
ncbi:MAG: 3-oxoacyl-ACP synthase, partial [Azonexus sp.]